MLRQTIHKRNYVDGCILEVIRCGFIDGNILIPQGVINELQIVADSNDSVKREKGKRGLDILNELYDLDYPTRSYIQLKHIVILIQCY